MAKQKEKEPETPVAEEPAAEEPVTVEVQYVGGHSEVRSSISGVWKTVKGEGEVKALPPDVAEQHLATTMFDIPGSKGGK